MRHRGASLVANSTKFQLENPSAGPLDWGVGPLPKPIFDHFSPFTN